MALLLGSLLSCARPSTPAARPGPRVAPAQAERGAFRITRGSARLVQSLHGELEIVAFVERGSPRLDRFANAVTKLVSEYERAGRGKVKVRIVQANTAELRQEARAAGLSLQYLGEGEATVRNDGYVGLLLRYQGEQRVIPQLSPGIPEGLEFWFSSKIHEIRDQAEGIKRRIGVVIGKGELTLADQNLIAWQTERKAPSIQSILAQAFPFYQLEDVDLRGGAGAIDPGLIGLIVTQPQQDYVEAELRRIDDFLMLGEKALVVYASAVNLKAYDTSMMAELSTRGLEPLLDGYGIHMNQDAVFDYTESFRVQAILAAGGTAWIRHPAIALVKSGPTPSGTEPRLDAGFAGFFRMEELILPFPSSLTLRRAAQPVDVRLQAVARSTSSASVRTDTTLSMALKDHWTPPADLQSRVLAAYAQGKLQSAFTAQSPAKTSVPLRARGSSRVLVVSSSLFATNPFAYAGNPDPAPLLSSGGGPATGNTKLLQFAQPYTKYLTTTILSIKNTLDWMSGDDDLIATSAQLIEGGGPHN